MKAKLHSGCKIIDDEDFEYLVVDCDEGYALICITTSYTGNNVYKNTDEILNVFSDKKIKILDSKGEDIMSEKYICRSCGEDLREVGVCKKVYENYSYIEDNDNFELSSSDESEGYLCACCDAYVEI